MDNGSSLPGPKTRASHLGVDLDTAEWYFCKKEEGMIPKILMGVLLGGAAGFALSYLTRGIGSS